MRAPVSGRRRSLLGWLRESPADFWSRESAPSLPVRSRSDDCPKKLAVRAERERFQIGSGHSNERGDGIPLDREDHGALLCIADVGRHRAACVSKLQRLHRSMTAFPIRTAFLSLTPTARTTTTGSGSMTTSKYTRRSPSRSSHGASEFGRMGLRLRDATIGSTERCLVAPSRTIDCCLAVKAFRCAIVAGAYSIRNLIRLSAENSCRGGERGCFGDSSITQPDLSRGRG